MDQRKWFSPFFCSIWYQESCIFWVKRKHDTLWNICRKSFVLFFIILLAVTFLMEKKAEKYFWASIDKFTLRLLKRRGNFFSTTWLFFRDTAASRLISRIFNQDKNIYRTHNMYRQRVETIILMRLQQPNHEPLYCTQADFKIKLT